jgi:hypothetical protein
MENIKEEILLKHLSNVELEFLQDRFGNLFNAMDEYAEYVNDCIYDLFNKPTLELKPLEELYRKENPMKDKDGNDVYYLPDTTKFYKWITNKIMDNEI